MSQRQIFGDQARPEARPASACSQTAAQAASNSGMPCAASPAMMPAQHVAGTRRRQQRRAVGVDGGAPVRRGDHRVRPLVDDDRIGARGSVACAFELGQAATMRDRETRGEFALVRRQHHDRAGQRMASREDGLWIGSDRRQRAGVDDEGGCGKETAPEQVEQRSSRCRSQRRARVRRRGRRRGAPP